MRILASGSMDARGFAVSAGPNAFASGFTKAKQAGECLKRNKAAPSE